MFSKIFPVADFSRDRAIAVSFPAKKDAPPAHWCERRCSAEGRFAFGAIPTQWLCQIVYAKKSSQFLIFVFCQGWAAYPRVILCLNLRHRT
jgi:hypothetical protein